MVKAKGGLGKGLGALIKTDVPKKVQPKEGQVQEIEIAKIAANINQPRTVFDKDALKELESSISQYGVLQPLLVKKSGNGYEIIAGERRYRAAKQAGLKTVPAIVRSYTEAQTTEIALIENLQRENLNIIEEALAYSRLMTEFKLTQEQVSEKIGKSRPYIGNVLRLLRLPENVQEALKDGTLTMGQARPLLAIDKVDVQLAAAKKIIEEQLSARQAEELVKKLLTTSKVLYEAPHDKEKEKSQQIYIKDAEDKLKMFFGAQVKITGGKKSRIEISLSSQEELDRILELISNGQRTEVEKKKDLLRKFSTKKFSV